MLSAIKSTIIMTTKVKTSFYIVNIILYRSLAFINGPTRERSLDWAMIFCVNDNEKPCINLYGALLRVRSDVEYKNDIVLSAHW